MTKLRLALICILLQPVCFVNAQEKKDLKAGLDFEITQIKPMKRKYLQCIETTTGVIMFQSVLIRKIENIKHEGKDCLVITQAYHSKEGRDKDSSICDRKTLLPLAYYSDLVSEGYKEEVIFDTKNSVNKTIYKDSIKSLIRPNKKMYNGVITDELISALIFEKDSVFNISAVNPGLLYSEYRVRVSILGKEELELPGMPKVICWKLNVNSGVGKGTMEWYTVKEHIQIKKTFELPDGSIFKRILLLD